MAAEVKEILSHWSQLVEDLKQSPQHFYTMLEEAIKKRNLPDIELSRVNHKEGGIFSAKREYLRVRRFELIFDICSALYGNGFFVSWWLGERPTAFQTLLLMIPWIGPAMVSTFKPETYYKTDVVLMFQSAINSAVQEVLDQVIKAKGLRSLTEAERKPIMRDLFHR